jgi:hypothetical protein
MKTSTIIILFLLAALTIDIFYWVVIRKRWPQIKNEILVFLKKPKQQIPLLPTKRLPPHTRQRLNTKQLFTIIEVSLIFVFALWVGRQYLDLNKETWPFGYEFSTSIQSHYNWIKFKECGLCFLWNGSIKGGAPSFVDLRGSWLHPLVAVSTIVFGFINGAKISIVFCLFLAGLAQWWIARLLKTGPLARLFTAAMAIVAGNLAASMNMGDVGRLLSHVSASLALAAGICFAQNANRRNAVGFGFAGALLLVSGQGYNQAGFFLCYLPALLTLFESRQWKEKLSRRNILLAGSLMVLLAGVFLIPVLHFLPQLYKDIDVNFKAAQPIEFVPLNLVINNYDFFSSTSLGKLPYISLYSIYIGWIPLLLALISLIFVRKDNYRSICSLVFQ